MRTLSDSIRACIAFDAEAEAHVRVTTDGGMVVTLVTIKTGELLDIATASEQLAAEREKSAKGLACIQDAIQKTEALTKERDEARARVKELEGNAEPVAWAIGGERVLAVFTDRLVAQRAWGGRAEPLYRRPPKPAGEPVAWRWVANGEVVLRFLPASPEWAGVEALTPLYEAPPPAAYGVETKTFAVVYGREFADLTPCEVDLVHVGSRQLAEEQADLGTLVRIIPADAPVVDVAAIRRAIEHLVDIHAYGAVGTLRAAIGDKAGS